MTHPLTDLIVAVVDRRIRRHLRLLPQTLLGVVDTTDPLTVVLDGDTDPTPIDLTDTAYTPTVGDRVRIETLPADTARHSRARTLIALGAVTSSET